MIFLDIAASAVIGQLVVLRDPAPIPESQRVLRHPAFAPTAVFVSSVYIPAVTLFLMKWPAMSWLYLVEPDVHLHGLAVAALFPAFLLGFATTHALVRRGRRKRAVTAMLALMGATGSLPILLWERASLVAPTPMAFESGAGQDLVTSGVLSTSAALVGSIIAAFALLWWRFLPTAAQHRQMES